MIEQAIEIAIGAHKGQKDLQGHPQILHAVRVMCAVLQKTTDENVITAAILHDVVEDTNWELPSIAVVFNDEVEAIVDALTRREGENYQSYIDNRVKPNDAARLIKLCDLADNLGRIPNGAEGQRKKWLNLRSRYEDAVKRLS